MKTVLSPAGSSSAPPTSVYLSIQERATLLTKAFLYYSGNHEETIRHAGQVVAKRTRAPQPERVEIGEPSLR